MGIYGLLKAGLLFLYVTKGGLGVGEGIQYAVVCVVVFETVKRGRQFISEVTVGTGVKWA